MKSQTHKASILAVSLIIMGVMFVISLGIASSALQSRKASIGSSKSSVAFQNADSGVEIIMQRIKDNSSDSNLNNIDNDGTCDGIYTSPDGKYRAELKDASGNIIDSSACGTTAVSAIDTVKSIGYSAQDTRAIEMAVAAGGSCAQVFNTIIPISTGGRYTVAHGLGGAPKFVQVYYCRNADPTCSGVNFQVQAWRWAPGGDFGAEYGADNTNVYIGVGTGGVFLSAERVDGGSSANEASVYYRIVACR